VMTFSFDADMRSVARRNYEARKSFLVSRDCVGLAHVGANMENLERRTPPAKAISRDPLQPPRVEVSGSEVGETPLEGLA